MKKHITLLSGLLLVSGAFAQHAKPVATPRMAQQVSTEAPKSTAGAPAPKALGTDIWTDNFSTASNWTFNNSGQTAPGYGWSIGTAENSWYFTSPINSQSDGAFAMLSNGLPQPLPGTQAPNVVYTMTTANPIDLTVSGTDLNLSFMQYGARFNDLQEVQVSTNGTTFTTVQNNNDHPTFSLAGGAAYTNSETRLVNISQAISGATQVWIRFRWTTNVPTSTSLNAWVTYGWFIDDVKLTTLPDYDLQINNDYWGTAGLGYYKIPTAQIAPIDFSLNLSNEGSEDMVDVTYGINVTGAATFTGSNTPVTIAAESEDSVFLTTPFTPTVVGTYNIARSLTADSIDDVPANNLLSNFSFDVTNYIYARDKGAAAGYTANGANPFETGNLFDIWAPQDLKGIDVRFATGTPVGSQVYVRLYKIDPNETKPVYVEESPVFDLAANQVNTNITVYLGQAIPLEANTTYLAMVGAYSADVKIANAGVSADQTSFLLNGNDMANNTLFFQNETPWVRLNFDPSLGVNELTSASNLSVYPNPFAGTTEVKFDLKADAKVSAVVTDLSGRTVATVPASQMAAGSQTIAIDGTSFQAGIYNVTLTVGNETTTKRIVKK